MLFKERRAAGEVNLFGRKECTTKLLIHASHSTPKRAWMCAIGTFVSNAGIRMDLSK